MTERKQTPDLLGELLGGSVLAQAPELTTLPGRASTAARPASDKSVVAQASPRQPAPKMPSLQAPQPMAAPARWEYLVVSFQEYKGWRPRFRNGEKIMAWEEQPLLHDYLNQLGAEGWEMAGASAGRALYGSRDEVQVYFKRPRAPV
jgi:hypothetical protein